MMRSKRPVSAISAEMGDLCPVPISSITGRVYLWPPDELESPSNPSIRMGFFRICKECRAVRLISHLLGSNWHLSLVKHECACVYPQHLIGQVLPDMNNVLENSVLASEGYPVLRFFS